MEDSNAICVNQQVVSPQVEQPQENKVFVFIDAENVRNSVEMYGYVDLDYVKLFNFFKNKLKVKRIYLYVGVERGDVSKLENLNKLKELGYLVSVKMVSIYYQKPFIIKVPCNNCGNIINKTIYRHNKQKANCDTELTLDIINCGVRKKYDEIIVFSGDGDFCKVYDYVSQVIKKTVKVYAPFDYHTSSKLKEQNKKGIIKLEDLRGLLQHYGKK